MQVQLSVVIITFNEEKNIARCIDSVQSITDDIVVVDSFSNDKTQEICKGYKNVTFISKKWEGYAKTKNFANQKAKYNYVLSLDADEVLSDKLKASISKMEKLNGVYEFNRLTNFCGTWIKHCGWYPDKKPRIFPKDAVHWVGNYVHETLDIPNNLEKHFLKGDLLHYSFYTFNDHIKQIEKYSTLQAEKAYKAGEKSNRFKIFYKSVFKFFRDYVLKLGFLDGYHGYVVCKNSAYAKKLKYTKLRDLYQNH